jgi:hypothetical protein
MKSSALYAEQRCMTKIINETPIFFSKNARVNFASISSHAKRSVERSYSPKFRHFHRAISARHPARRTQNGRNERNSKILTNLRTLALEK